MFPEQTVHRIRFIKRAQELGFSLAEIGDLLSIQVDPNNDCSNVKRLTEGCASENEMVQRNSARVTKREGVNTTRLFNHRRLRQ